MYTVKEVVAMSEQILQFEKQNAKLVKVLKELVYSLPESEIELAREVWGNTNTRIIGEAREKGWQAIVQASKKSPRPSR